MASGIAPNIAAIARLSAENCEEPLLMIFLGQIDVLSRAKHSALPGLYVAR